MGAYDVVIIVLVYRNSNDLQCFFDSLKINNCKVIVVNSYYDIESENRFKEIAQKNDADYISVPNKGYGAGNNLGCRYALDNYLFKYLVISNADVTIDVFNLSELIKYEDSIIAPKIINLSNKPQNPSMPFKPCALFEKMRFWIYRGNHSKIIWIYYAYLRLTKVIYYAISRYKKEIFSAHGSFVIFPFSVVQRLYPFYNEEMFLFNEEEHLGRHALCNGIKTYYVPEIIIRHKEDGSMNLANMNEFEKKKQSYLVYYWYWFLSNNHQNRLFDNE